MQNADVCHIEYPAASGTASLAWRSAQMFRLKWFFSNKWMCIKNYKPADPILSVDSDKTAVSQRIRKWNTVV